MKMRLLTSIVTILICIFVFVLCIAIVKGTFPEIFEDYAKWDIINIKNYGTVKIPCNWSVIDNNGFIVFIDERKEVIAVQVGIGEIDRDSKRYVMNEFYKFIFIECIYSEVFSNSATYAKYTCEYNENIDDLFIIGFNTPRYESSIAFIDKSIGEDIVRKIAISLSPYD